MKYSIGIDIGTTTVKSILFGEGVKVVAEGRGSIKQNFQEHPGRNKIPKIGGRGQ